jgi:hypothetical protein
MTLALVMLAVIAAVLVATLAIALGAGRRAADVPLERRAAQPLLTRPCPGCGAQMPTHQTRCGVCHAALSSRRLLCPKCGLHVGAVMRFCKRCHTQINHEASA